MSIKITARIERRTWYTNGQYLGDKATFYPDKGETAKELTGDFYGDWEGTRHFDGEQIVTDHLAREIDGRRLLITNHPGATLGELHCHPCKLGDWGEYRIVTCAAASL